MAVRYIARVGISYPTAAGERRAEPGDVVPAAVVQAAPWLLEQDLVRPEEAPRAAPAR